MKYRVRGTSFFVQVATSALLFGAGVSAALGGVHGSVRDAILSASFIFGAISSAFGAL